MDIKLQESKVSMVSSGKCGVGKTTTVANVSYCFSQGGYK
jgi:MinD-like ATPase involved in chromosome partitioning or flagellar assembly